MPYIPRHRRPVARAEPESIGELTYKLTVACTEYLGQWPYGYSELAAILGALEATKQEFYRRVVVPYENSKCVSNGDVYTDRPVGGSSYDDPSYEAWVSGRESPINPSPVDGPDLG